MFSRVIVDTSGMFHRLESVKLDTGEFLETAAPAHEASLMSVSSQPKIESGLTQKATEVQNRLPCSRPSGSTSLAETVYMGAETDAVGPPFAPGAARDLGRHR
jgi:hypothetical protein